MPTRAIYTTNTLKSRMKYITLACSALLVGLDQLFKYLAIVYLSNDILTYPIIQDVFHLTYVENRGAAFSILEGKQFFLVGLTSAILIAICVIVLMGKVKSKFLLVAASLIIGGGFGNLVDRIFRGFVVDYLDFRIINFAVFNLADCCVVIGTGLIMIYILFIDGKKNSEEKKEISGEHE